MRWVLVLLWGLATLPAAALDRDAFSFTHYDLQVTLDPHQHGLAVEGTVELRNASKGAQREVVLQISSSLSWLSVLVKSLHTPNQTVCFPPSGSRKVAGWRAPNEKWVVRAAGMTYFRG